MEKRMLRGHHLLCVHGFQKMGYSKEFVMNMEKVVDEIRDENHDYDIQVIAGLDDLCSACPNKKEEVCRSANLNEHVMKLDDKVLKHLGIKAGNVYRKNELVRLVAERVQPNDLEYLCEGCSWLEYDVCKQGIKKLQASFQQKVKKDISLSENDHGIMRK